MSKLRYNGSHKVKNGRYVGTSRTIVKATLGELMRYKNLGRCQMNSTDLPGQDLRKLQGLSWDACKLACAKDRHCQAITYRTEDRSCWLKKGTPNGHNKPGLKSSTIRKKRSGGSGQRA